MASKLQEDLSCPVCKDIFKDPVILSCKHSFCNDCLQKYWANKNDLGCPVCKRKSSKECPPVYFELKKRCEAFLQERASEPVCSLRNSASSVWMSSCYCADTAQIKKLTETTVSSLLMKHLRTTRKNLRIH